MHRLSTDVAVTPTPGPGTGTDVRCPVCGDPVRGIAATRPGEHRFVGCDHYASARFLRSYGDGLPRTGGRFRIGP